MQIVIEISEERFNSLKAGFVQHGSIAERMIVDAVRNGTALPEHGRLIDADDLLDNLYRICDSNGTLEENPYRDNLHIDSIVDVVESMPTIIQVESEE